MAITQDSMKATANLDPTVRDVPSNRPRTTARSPMQDVDLSLKQRLLWPLVRQYARLELPRFGQILNRWGVDNQDLWNRAHMAHARERYYGYRMWLDLADFHQRIAYFFGCYTELHVLSAIRLCLRPGEVFVDGGANVGLTAMHAAGRVGPSGRVLAFEPSSRALEQLRWHVETNGLRWIEIHGVGLSDVEDEFILQVPGRDNLAAGTLCEVPDRYGGEVALKEIVRTVRGDDVIDPDDPTPLTVKLDVEGFELRALRGMARVIECRKPPVISEVNEEMLGMSGTSAGELDGFLRDQGYRCFAMERRGMRGRYRLLLHHLPAEEVRFHRDVVWAHPEGVHWSRLAGSMVGA